MSHAEKTLTLEEFFDFPETKPASEFIDGEVVQRVSPKTKHSCLQIQLACRYQEAVRRNRHGMTFTELRCTFGGRSLVFDLAYFLWARIGFDRNGEFEDDIVTAPDWVTEILSPGQTITNMTGRLEWCIEKGVRLGWLVVPSRKLVYVFRPGQETETCGGNTVLDAGDVLPGFSLTPEEIFAWLRPAAG